MNDTITTIITVLSATVPTIWALLNEYLAWKKRKGQSEVACVGDCVRTLLRRRRSVDIEYALPQMTTRPQCDPLPELLEEISHLQLNH